VLHGEQGTAEAYGPEERFCPLGVRPSLSGVHAFACKRAPSSPATTTLQHWQADNSAQACTSTS
jgi:hypothetical protein